MAPGKSLLRSLEDENTAQARELGGLKQELRTVRQQLRERDRALDGLVDGGRPKRMLTRNDTDADVDADMLRAARNQVAALSRLNTELRAEMRKRERHEAGRGAELARLAEELRAATEARDAARARDAEARSTIARLEQVARDSASLHEEYARECAALRARVSSLEGSDDARVNDWIHERRRIMNETRAAREEVGAILIQ